jgi:hypothetical protein
MQAQKPKTLNIDGRIDDSQKCNNMNSRPIFDVKG